MLTQEGGSTKKSRKLVRSPLEVSCSTNHGMIWITQSLQERETIVQQHGPVKEEVTRKTKGNRNCETQKALEKMDQLAISSRDKPQHDAAESSPKELESVRPNITAIKSVKAHKQVVDVVHAQLSPGKAVRPLTAPVNAGPSGTKVSTKVIEDQTFHMGASTKIDAGKVPKGSDVSFGT
jgi:hypothetical protein